MFEKMYDVAVIGAGVTGAMIARKLAEYKLSICILERCNGVAMGATRANSAIVHAGFDAKEGSLKARMNVRGSEMMEEAAAGLGVKYIRNGSLVIGFNREDREEIEKLYHRGMANGVKSLSILEKEELHAMEPALSPLVECALYAPTGAIICPYELTIAAVGNAMDNGAVLYRNFEVCEIGKTTEGFFLRSTSKAVEETGEGVSVQKTDVVCAKIVINAAGLYADTIARMVGDDSFSIHPRKGEYLLLDKECGNLVKHTVFRTPSKMGKGILVTPTVDGNLLTGPTSQDIENKEETVTSAEGMEKIISQSRENVPQISYGKTITSFCGLRAVGSTGDFIINAPVQGFINVAGIESPGLTSAPAIAEYVVQMAEEQGIVLEKKSGHNPCRAAAHHFREASVEEKNRIIKENKSYGKIVCRCEGISEGEILAAIRTAPRAMDLDGVKRRTRAQMGRCQGGFCSPRIVELLAREWNIPVEQVTKSGGQSFVNVKKTKEDM